MFEAILGLLPILLPALGGLYGVIQGIKFVSEGERAIMLRFDKAIKRRGQYKVILPGLRLMIPTIHKLARIHVRQRTINLPSQTIILKDKTVFDVSAVILCRVKDTPQDLYNALFETTGINEALTDYGLLVVRAILADLGHEELINDKETIANQLQERIQRQADQWGVQIITFELSDCDPGQETTQLIQISAQTAFRVEAIKASVGQLTYADIGRTNPAIIAALFGVPIVVNSQRDPGTNNGQIEEEVEELLKKRNLI